MKTNLMLPSYTITFSAQQLTLMGRGLGSLPLGESLDTYAYLVSEIERQNADASKGPGNVTPLRKGDGLEG